MTDYQNELVMEHLDLVNWVIRTRISVPNRPLLTYDDFYAIGCEAICRAALKYQADSGEFAPFACRYIYNAIIDHCRAMNYRLQRSVDAGFEEGEVLFDLLAHTTVDFEAEVTDDSATMISTYLQATEQVFPSILIQLLRQFLLLIPFMWSLEKLLKITGIWLSFPVTETATFVLALLIFRAGRKKETLCSGTKTQ